MTLTATLLATFTVFALGVAPLLATEDCPPADPPGDEPSESAMDTSVLPLPVRPAPKLSVTPPQTKSNARNTAPSVSVPSQDRKSSPQTGGKAR